MVNNPNRKSKSAAHAVYNHYDGVQSHYQDAIYGQ